MRHCFKCDQTIDGQGYRRTVKTGQSNRTYYGKRISTSSSTSRGLRLLCSECARSHDDRASFENKLGFAAVCVVTVFALIAWSVGGRSAHKNVADTFVLPASASPESASAGSNRDRGLSTNGTNSIIVTTPTPTSNDTGSGTVKLSPPLSAQQFASAINVPRPGGWQYTTQNGVRWDLTRVNDRSITLVLDLGGSRTAKVIVDNAFEYLSSDEMDARVDWLVSSAIPRTPSRSGKYSFSRDGAVRPVP